MRHWFASKKNSSLLPARSRHLSLESLEGRDLLAGNVTASIVGGDLVIKGDTATNGVAVTRLDAATIEVRGTSVGGVGTSLNGTLNGRVNLTGLTDDVIVDMYSGHDQISFFGTNATLKLTVPDDLIVYTQEGNDQVGMFNVFARDNLTVVTGSGQDTFTGNGVQTGNNLFVKEADTPHYAGDYNFVNIYNNSNIGGQLNVKFNQGNDTLKVSKTSADSYWLEGRAGNDTFFIDDVEAVNDLRIDPGTGSDTTTVQYSTQGDDLWILENNDSRPSSDVDRVTISNCTANDYLEVRGNNSRDIVRIFRCTAETLNQVLSAGDDSLDVKYTTATYWLLDGGSGIDSLNRFGNSATFSSRNFNRYTYNSAS